LPLVDGFDEGFLIVRGKKKGQTKEQVGKPYERIQVFTL
jgi:hypothetical protein